MSRKKLFSEFIDICERVSSKDASLARTGVISKHADAIQKDINDITSGRKKTLGTSDTPSVTRSGRRRIEFIDRSRSTDQGNTRRGPRARRNDESN